MICSGLKNYLDTKETFSAPQRHIKSHFQHFFAVQKSQREFVQEFLRGRPKMTRHLFFPKNFARTPPPSSHRLTKTLIKFPGASPRTPTSSHRHLFQKFRQTLPPKDDVIFWTAPKRCPTKKTGKFYHYCIFQKPGGSLFLVFLVKNTDF